MSITKKVITGMLLLLISSVLTSSQLKAATSVEQDLQRQIALVNKQIPKGDKYRCTRYHALIKDMELPVEIVSYLMWRESRCQPKAIGWNYKKGMSHKDCKLSPFKTYKKCRAVKSYDLGLMQINSSWVTVTHNICGKEWGDMTVLLQVKCNLRVAKYLLLQDGGLRNWGFKV